MDDSAISADPTGNLKALLNSPDAAPEAKWALMHNLTIEFLYPFEYGSGRKRSGDVDEMFDGDQDRIDLFYSALQSFQTLLEAEPLKRPDLKNEIGADIDFEAIEFNKKRQQLASLGGMR